MGASLGNTDNHLWEMKNGYVLATEKVLIEITKVFGSATDSEIDDLRKLLRIGVQWNTEVTLSDSKHTVTQIYCSVLPVAYSPQLPPRLWEGFSRIVLEASYEASLCAGILNFQNTGSNKVYLTLVGGGAFGNDIRWIMDAMTRSLDRYKNVGLDVIIVSFRSSSVHVQELIY